MDGWMDLIAGIVFPRLTVKVKRNEVHEKLKTKDELNVLIGLDSMLASHSTCPLPASAAILWHWVYSYRRVLVKLSTLAVHKSISFGSLHLPPFIDLPSHRGLEGPQPLQGEFNFSISHVQVDSSSSNHLPAPCL